MNIHFTNLLFNTYPDLYKGRSEPITHSLMPFGFDGIEDGWFLILWRLSESLTKLGNIKATQVKEKFGGLRFYFEGRVDNSDNAWNLIEEAENECLQTCMFTGKPAPGPRPVRGWLYTVCDEIYNRLLNEK